jgi:hypothetical protein
MHETRGQILRGSRGNGQVNGPRQVWSEFHLKVRSVPNEDRHL